MSFLLKHDYQSIFLYNFKHDFCTQEFYEGMLMVFHDDYPSLKTVEQLYEIFQRGIFELKDDPHSGQLLEVLTPENVASKQKLIVENHNITD